MDRGQQIRALILGLVLAGGFTVFWGCQPAVEPAVDREDELSVSLPGDSSDPGQLTGDPIKPPDVGVDPPGDSSSLVVDADPSESGSGTQPTDSATPMQKRPLAANEADDGPLLQTAPVAARPAAIPTAPETGEGKASTEAPQDWTSWPKPPVMLVVTGQQHGYFEPCGCTGLENQKGGMSRRFTMIDELRESGLTVVPIDGGNQVRRYGKQAAIKFQTTVSALQQMEYATVGFGPDDMRLGVGELLSVAAADGDEALFASANVVLVDPDYMPTYRKMERNGQTILVTTLLDPDAVEVDLDDGLVLTPVAESLPKVAAEMKQHEGFRTLMYYGEEAAAIKALQEHAAEAFDLMVVVGGYGEPFYKPKSIEGVDTRYIVTGDKSMHVGLVGVYPDKSIRYNRVALTERFEDAPEMMQAMASYQDQLKQLGFDGLELRMVAHPKGDQFVGSKVCGECHTTAYDIWEGTPHVEATEDIVHPPNSRGSIARHFDPECISCHVTGWDPQGYFPYLSGYQSLEASEHLFGNGCENCHGPGAAHAAAERANSGVAAARLTQLREAMRLPLEKAREKCLECHDLDNSPDFHEEHAFEDIYWPQVEHYGLD